MINNFGKNDNNQTLPFVSVCTPTFNRRPFIPIIFECFRNQTYPKDRIEWIIVDDGTDKIEDLIKTSNIHQIRYFTIPYKLTLGKKRNFSHSQCRGDFIVYMDDDDYYPPNRISHAVETLLKNPQALCAGSSEIYTYFKGIQKMIQFGPYELNHSTAGTFAFRKELLRFTRYNDEQAIAEERDFLRGYTIPFVQLDPLKTILVFSHEHNSFDKRKLLENPNPMYVKESCKTVDDFIKGWASTEKNIKKFFLEDIDLLLKNYDPGSPSMKPDVLEQIKKIEIERRAMMEKEMREKPTNEEIYISKQGEPPTILNKQQIVQLLQEQQTVIQQQTALIQHQQNIIEKLQQGEVLFTKGDFNLDENCQSNEFISLNHQQILEIIQTQKRIIMKYEMEH
jgi:glycosyltransferase involved in cell wall biosynthesis